ncbi:MAG TPA: NAD(P)-dependent oxidoreductase, partial [Burkholderiales bacterium]|nr:NAD(P)-dependent oxidoreductase [Burkholderiales bacterium]
MNVLVTGATGFVGRHVVAELLRQGHTVVALSRSRERADPGWQGRLTHVEHDLREPMTHPFERLGRPDLAMHLAWQGLPHYGDTVHTEVILPAS